MAVRVLTVLAEGQWGLFTTAQAQQAGMLRAEIVRAVGALGGSRVRHGVYSLPGSPVGALQDVRAQWLAMDASRTVAERHGDPEPIVVSHETAAEVWQIGDFDPDHLYFTSPRRLRSGQPNVVVRKAPLPGRTVQEVDGLPVTSPRRTLEDIAESGRWDEDHLRRAIVQAHSAGVLSRRDVESSKVLRRLAPELGVPDSDRSVQAKLRNAARAAGEDATGSYSRFHRMLFVGRLMVKSEGWVLKGGMNLVARSISSRLTRDIDVFREGSTSAFASARDLARTMNGEVIGNYIYEVSGPSEGAAEGEPTASLTVGVRVGGQTATTFGIDVSASVVMAEEPLRATVDRGDRAHILGYPSSLTLNFYPLENQVADKIAAMYEKRSGRSSTRYRDLYDVALIAETGEVDVDRLAQALAAQVELRSGLELPTAIIEPDTGWGETFDRVLERTVGAEPPNTSFEVALASAQRAFGSALAKARALAEKS